MPTLIPKSFKNQCDFGTCDFLFFAKCITLKSFFYMIRGTKNKPKSIKNPCKNEGRKNDDKMSQQCVQKGSKNGSKSRCFMLKSAKGSRKGPKCALRIDFVSQKGIPKNMSKFEATRNHKQPDPVTDGGAAKCIPPPSLKPDHVPRSGGTKGRSGGNSQP